jgi:hypothetical protein
LGGCETACVLVLWLVLAVMPLVLITFLEGALVGLYVFRYVYVYLYNFEIGYYYGTLKFIQTIHFYLFGPSGTLRFI